MAAFKLLVNALKHLYGPIKGLHYLKLISGAAATKEGIFSVSYSDRIPGIGAIKAFP